MQAEMKMFFTPKKYMFMSKDEFDPSKVFDDARRQVYKERAEKSAQKMRLLGFCFACVCAAGALCMLGVRLNWIHIQRSGPANPVVEWAGIGILAVASVVFFWVLTLKPDKD
jgi:hypothetical protein